MSIDGVIYLMTDAPGLAAIMASPLIKDATAGGPEDSRWLVYQEPTCIEIWTGDRYYGPGYYRGQWPQIRETIQLLQATYPGIEIRYGRDTEDGPDDRAAIVTTEWIAERDAQWGAEN
jgi:hypothetical protein